jgi:hypothetical protein
MFVHHTIVILTADNTPGNSELYEAARRPYASVGTAELYFAYKM